MDNWKSRDLLVAVSGIPRGYHYPSKDGNWLLPHHVEKIKSISEAITLIEIPADEVKNAHLDGIEVVLAEGGNREHYAGELDWADYVQFFTPSLRWVQLCSTGFSDNITPQILSGEVILTNAPGLHTTPIAESVLMAMLQHAKNLPQRWEDQHEKRWRQLKNKELFQSTVLILGLGKIGKEVARLCHSFGMSVIGTKKNVEDVPYVDQVFPTHDLERYLPQADFVVLALPATQATNRIINRRSFGYMKESAYLINIGRGQTVDEEALIRALEREQIAGAYLDAFVQEPLAKEHPLWTTKNCTLIPHDSHSSPYIGDRMVDIFCKNLEHYVRGEPLQHICDPHRGY